MIGIIKVYGGMLLAGLGQTLLLTLLALIIAMVIGMIFGLMNVGHNRSTESDRNSICRCCPWSAADRSGILCIFWYPGWQCSGMGMTEFPPECSCRPVPLHCP